jgi:hypothetical protein
MPAPHFNRGHRVFPPPLSQEVGQAALPASQPQPPNLPPSTLERPKECINRHPTPAFALLCTIMDRMRSEEAGKRKETLMRFMGIWRIKVGNDLYPLIRLLLPDVSLPCPSRALLLRHKDKPAVGLFGRIIVLIRPCSATGRDRFTTSKKPC